jgi:capsular polysaccharide biosynthesis protein
MKLIFSAPDLDDLSRLLKAWRFWLLGALLGALIGGAVYLLFPPPYRATATVNVDFHLEQAWPQNTDREQFYYLEREARKLEDIALSDSVLQVVATQVQGVTIQQLRGQSLELSQPGNGGWHFYGLDRDPHKAAALASAWGQAFAQIVQSQVSEPSSGLEQYITVTPTQTQKLSAHPSVSLGIYMLAAAVLFLAISVLMVLFFKLQR